ncbi:usg protein [Martelella endophytica]|uniref:Usg n=1 Tax=Martelella endophytica TaxID=1486262 RepID=A0A0D5LR48_MAREN|nr:aspartate-semialdehyde dehydrogenase [Martelella endophytica]AJY45823.1 Usg [Martelella endophytica]
MRFASEFEMQLAGYGLTTAHILYRLPDFDSLLQTYVWQHYDLAPDFPEMNKFLAFWKDNLEGPLHSVRYAHKHLIGPNEWRQVTGEFAIH